MAVDLKYAESLLRDREVRARFLDLARELGSLGVWVRLHYVYPYPHVDEVIAADGGRQGAALSRHAVPARCARSAARRCAGRATRRRRSSASRAWRAICPDLTIRSTFIVGFPGETRRGFSLASSTGSTRRSSTASAPSNTSRSRARRQRSRARAGGRRDQGRAAGAASCSASRRSARSSSRPRSASGSTCIDRSKAGAAAVKGRSKGDAPEIDGNVHVATRRPLRVGEIVNVKIERADAYDLWGAAG